MLCVSVVFFKQKTAYEMRISDWSSDVCSSDLKKKAVALTARAQPAQEHRGCDFARLDRDGDLQEVLPVGLDQRPVDRAMKERIDMRISCLLVGAEKIEVLPVANPGRSEEHTSELQSLMRISYAVFCLNKKKQNSHNPQCTKPSHTRHHTHSQN